MRYLIGLDLGTTTVKATVYTEKGVAVADASLERILLTSKEGYYEQDANTWYEDSCRVIKEATKNIDKNSVLGMSVSSQGITTVPVDENINPLNNAINWMDVRDVASWNGLLDAVGVDYIKKTTGNVVYYNTPKFVAKMMWVKENLPEVYEKTRYFLMPASFVTAKFTGKVFTDATMAAGSMLFSNKTGQYDDSIIEKTGINKDMLAPLMPMGTCVGKLTKKAAEDCGLTTDCIFALGGQDQKVAAYALGIKEGQVSCSMGTSAAFEFAVDNSDFYELPVMFKVCPFYDNKFVLEGVIKTGGGAIRWLRDAICIGSDYEEMNKRADLAPIGSHGTVFISYLGGNPENNGFASFNNVGLHTTHNDLIRAVYEGVAFEAVRIIKSINIDVDKICIYSGGSKNKLLCQIIADVSEISVVAYSHSEMGSLGAAKLAAKAIGIDENEFTNECLKNAVTYIPQNTEEYMPFYENYLKFLKGK